MQTNGNDFADSMRANIEALMQPVLRLVVRAGADVMAVYERGHHESADIGLRSKADASPVTEADLSAHRRLDAGLAALRPSLPVVSEENEASFVHRVPQGRFWLIDPVDGTREFLSRTGEFTVNVALVVDGQARFGVVYAPALAQLYWGGRGLGAWRCQIRPDATFAGSCEGEIISVAPFPVRGEDQRFERPLRVMASRSHMNEATRRHVDQLQPQTLVQAGSSLKFCRIAEGQADYYPRLGPTSEWDTAAAHAVVEGAGGQVLALAGSPLTYGRPDVLNPHFVVTAEPVQ